MNKMKELLNKLIEKGWKPFGREVLNIHITIFDKIEISYIEYETSLKELKSIRDIVSLESGLRQFVCENKLLKNADEINPDYALSDGEHLRLSPLDKDGRYWIRKSALTPIDKIEKFLIENILI